MKVRRQTPFSFVAEALEQLDPLLKPMFGCTAIYVDGKMMLILREKEDHVVDNGVWIATSFEHHESLRKEFPSMRHVNLLAGGNPTRWQNLGAEHDDFESMAMRAVKLVLKGDQRIGIVPKPKKKTKGKKK